MRYELFFLVGSSKEMDLPKIKQEVIEIITSDGGVIEEKQTEEKRRLAYKIKHETHGIYIALRFNIEDSEKITSLNKKMALRQDVLRTIISRASELPELMSKEERKAKYSPEAKSAAPTEQKKSEIKKAKETKPAVEAKIIAPEKKEELEATEKDLDKKLEEILNI